MASLLRYLTIVALLCATSQAAVRPSYETYLGNKAAGCPDYTDYAAHPHTPYSDGPLKLPYQRPAEECRTFRSAAVEKVISDLKERMVDKDLARLFENAFPNTLDTTVRWHVDSTPPATTKPSKGTGTPWQGPQSFIVTGDITAEWLRDSTNQLRQYQPLAKKDEALRKLILGAINTQSEYVIESPYCNAFQPPPASGLKPAENGQSDFVNPPYEKDAVFECKYELDSLAHFLALGNTYFNFTGKSDYVNNRYLSAVQEVINVIDAQSLSTFDTKTGVLQNPVYTFQRNTHIGTETLDLGGRGNPLAANTGLVRSAFRPSDDATNLPYLIPANAQMSVELKRTAEVMRAIGQTKWANELQSRGEVIEKGVWEHGVVEHKKWGKVFAFEVDGYGSQIIMDDANLPSLLALPLLGFVDKENPVYQNTRKMVLQAVGNPYHIEGQEFAGIGGPHIGLSNAWPMSLLVQAMTSDDDKEIINALGSVLKSSQLGLVHESIDVNNVKSYTRPWFAWANSVLAQTVLDLAQRKPHLLFGAGAAAYEVV